MWRSLFIAFGIMAVIVGLECLFIDSAYLYSAGETKPGDFFDPSGAPSVSGRVWRPKEYLPWTLMAVGAIVIVYAFSLPSRWRGAAT